jgi:hypothetical protein
MRPRYYYAVTNLEPRLRIPVTLALIAVVVFPSPGTAQRRASSPPPTPPHRAELTAFGGYTFGGSLDVLQGQLTIPDAVSYGASLDVAARPGSWVEVLWSQQPSQLNLKRSASVADSVSNLITRYFHVGGVQDLGRGRAVPFAGLTLGATQFDPADANLGSTWRFSGAPVLGFKLLAARSVGLRGQGRLWLTFFPDGGAIACGGGGCFTAVSGTLVVQGEVSGGLFVAF